MPKKRCKYGVEFRMFLYFCKMNRQVSPRTIIVAIDSLKGCLTSRQANAAAAHGFVAGNAGCKAVGVTVSDGGEGWLDAWEDACGGQRHALTVHDALGRGVRAEWLQVQGRAIVESAQAVGLSLLNKEERDPLRASSLGVAEIVADALRMGCRDVVVGLGGTATSDAGRGMMPLIPALQAVGARFTIATDVENPLYGPHGAACVFGPQKGATPAMVQRLDDEARALADENARRMGRDLSHEPGAGAGGGLGYAFLQLLGAERRSGAEMLLEAIGFDQMLCQADLVVTGEGHADRQTLMGKLPSVILRHAQKAGVPTLLLAGRVSDSEALLNAGFADVRCIHPYDLPLSEAMRPEVTLRNIRQTCSAYLQSIIP